MPDGTHPKLFAESSCVCIPKFYACSSILFYGTNTIFGFLGVQKVMWPYRYAYDVPLVALILNIYIYIWVCGSDFNRSSINHRQTQTD